MLFWEVKGVLFSAKKLLRSWWNCDNRLYLSKGVEGTRFEQWISVRLCALYTNVFGAAKIQPFSNHENKNIRKKGPNKNCPSARKGPCERKTWEKVPLGKKVPRTEQNMTKQQKNMQDVPWYIHCCEIFLDQCIFLHISSVKYSCVPVEKNDVYRIINCLHSCTSFGVYWYFCANLKSSKLIISSWKHLVYV